MCNCCGQYRAAAASRQIDQCSHYRINAGDSKENGSNEGWLGLAVRLANRIRRRVRVIPPAGRPDPQDVPTKILEDELAGLVAISRRGQGMICRAIRFVPAKNVSAYEDEQRRQVEDYSLILKRSVGTVLGQSPARTMFRALAGELRMAR